MSKDAELQRRMRQLFARTSRAFEGMSDAARLATDAWVRAERREWEFPDLVLEDDERDAIRARQMGRTLAAIDEIPTTKERA